ncbi:hypothetical protein, partial [Novacetimonas hansenii]|uniref:hypothetical protein n=1 Tax=Novacetimonas hansenii TaxID=436 RepID=UPI001C3FBB27
KTSQRFSGVAFYPAGQRLAGLSLEGLQKTFENQGIIKVILSNNVQCPSPPVYRRINTHIVRGNDPAGSRRDRLNAGYKIP